jgi:tocopherol O-methyltransferase
MNEEKKMKDYSVRTDQPILADREKITQTIAKFWDKMSEGWKVVWGQHIHHGYYENNQALTPLKAQEKLIVKLAELIEMTPNAKVLDVGCGMGGSSIYLAKNYHTLVTGITLSPKQVEIASRTAEENNIKNVSFKIEDALLLESFADNSFDIIWSLESCEQFFDKNMFIKQAYRVLKPGGKLMLATWCSSCDEYQGKLAKKYQALCSAFDLPYMPTIECYRNFLTAENFTIKSSLDWSLFVKKSWDIGVSLVNAYTFMQLLKMGGWRGWRFAKQIKLMRDAFHQNRVRYGVFLAIK